MVSKIFKLCIGYATEIVQPGWLRSICLLEFDISDFKQKTYKINTEENKIRDMHQWPMLANIALRKHGTMQKSMFYIMKCTLFSLAKLIICFTAHIRDFGIKVHILSTGSHSVTVLTFLKGIGLFYTITIFRK